MKILSIETSCDETAVALVEATGDLSNPQFKVLNKKVHSQIEEHKEYGGVYPSLAKREHAKNLVPVTSEVLKDFKSMDPRLLRSVNDLPIWDDVKVILEREPELFEALENFFATHEKPDADMIAVTSGPGLEPALWVGINFARVLSIVWEIPLMPVNHMEGHMTSVLFGSGKVEFPALALLISGGHTELVSVKNWNEYKILGKTRDDAVGESYDKVARLLGIPYPGGPEISKMAEEYRKGNMDSEIKFPRPMTKSDDLDFSFSGLKTAVLYKTQEFEELSEEKKIEIAGEFEQAVIDVLTNKVGKALNTDDFKSIIVAGGVVANKNIRENISQIAKDYGIKVFFPEQEDSTDNAQMISTAAYLKSFVFEPKIGIEIKANGGLTY
jgi:N6-L-threonylcarbamoyladenine synthase